MLKGGRNIEMTRKAGGWGGGGIQCIAYLFRLLIHAAGQGTRVASLFGVTPSGISQPSFEVYLRLLMAICSVEGFFSCKCTLEFLV